MSKEKWFYVQYLCNKCDKLHTFECEETELVGVIEEFVKLGFDAIKINSEDFLNNAITEAVIRINAELNPTNSVNDLLKGLKK